MVHLNAVHKSKVEKAIRRNVSKDTPVDNLMMITMSKHIIKHGFEQIGNSLIPDLVGKTEKERLDAFHKKDAVSK